MTKSNNNLEKKTKGRRKIEIRKIDNKNSLQVTFSKRRTGLFKKAAETSLLCGANIVILIQSPGNKFFTFGEPSVESILNRYQFLDDSFSTESNPTAHNLLVEERSENNGATRGFWWQKEKLETMELQELEAFEEKLKVLVQAGEMKRYQFLDDSFSTESNLTAHDPLVEERIENDEATREFWWQKENLETMDLQELEAFEEKLNPLLQAGEMNRCQFLDDSFSTESDLTSHNLLVEDRSENDEATREFGWENENMEIVDLQELEAFEEELKALLQAGEMNKQIASASCSMIPLPQQ
ncbi:agamous-like MADS-box AGL62 [Olea europaea subsp. europaea]|uniref:Agamous-like MADS-box AGL62 n=1 Tax=Olea europaea subsp. europaea TaxID=158383 RepID=A0A8S0UEU3_OLEEU|nr:agamous-like MADS-box AGL62 [Olea europaea subsp. europaea]